MRRGLFFVLLFVALTLNVYVDYVLTQENIPAATEWLIIGTNLLDVTLFVGLFIFFVNEMRSNRKTEAALRQSLKHLSEVNEALKMAEAERSIFFKKTVHDLKNPLGTIRGFAELMHEDRQEPGTIARMSHTIQRISDGTLSLVNSLLAEKRNREGGKNFKSLDLYSCVAETCRYLEPMAADKDQKIEVAPIEGPVWVAGDNLRMRDVFFNLVGNAIKFSPFGATTRIRFEFDASRVAVVVEDEGPGLTGDDLSKLYLPGQRLSARATAGEPSTGFGLYSVKETVELHGGSLEAFNNPEGRGASFVVRLGLTDAAQFVKPGAVFCPPKSNAADTLTCGSSEPTI